MKRIIGFLVSLAILLGLWEFAASSSTKIAFLFASPSRIVETLFKKIGSGELVLDSVITGYEALLGLILGVVIGSAIGFLLLYFPKSGSIPRFYLFALGAIPVYGIAPMMIIWFGTGISMKVAMAFFSTVFVSISQSLQGGKTVKREDDEFFRLNQASKRDMFWKLTFPASIEWIIQSLRLNTGLAILGAFIGEFIASNQGLGYRILRASGLYDVAYVLAAIICISLLTLAFNGLVVLMNRNKRRIVRYFSLKM